MMLEEIMNSINNHFLTDIRKDGEITIEDGKIVLDFITDGMYFMIEGSLFNDGVYQAPKTDLTDEVFNGTVCVLCPPQAFLSLASDISTYCEKNPAESNITSESFGGYSYSKATNAHGTVAGWQDVFRTRLNQWRKL